jgi:hypothetical protein
LKISQLLVSCLLTLMTADADADLILTLPTIGITVGPVSTPAV